MSILKETPSATTYCTILWLLLQMGFGQDVYIQHHYIVCHINYFMWMLGFVRHLPIIESANTGIILLMHPANGRRRYNVTSPPLAGCICTKQSLQTGGSGCPQGLHIGPALWQPIGSADCSFLSNVGLQHYSDIIMRMMASQITRVSIVCSAVYSGADQRKHQSSASLALLRGIHQWIPLTKGQ